MITGHLGIAGAVYAGRRDSSLVWLLGAAIAPDVVDGLFTLVGSCNPHGLYSHTLPAAVLIAAVIGGTAYLATGQRATGLLAALLVVAHLPPDFITGRKLFWPGGELMGLRLYDHAFADFVLEATLAIGGWWLLRAKSWAPRWATGWPALVVLLALQATADGIGSLRGGVKPTACAAMQPVAS